MQPFISPISNSPIQEYRQMHAELGDSFGVEF